MMIEGGTRRTLTLAAIASLAAGLALFFSEAARPLFPGVDDSSCATPSSYLVNVVDLTMYVAIGTSLFLFRALARDSLGRAASATGVVAAVANIVTGVVNGVEHCAHVEALGGVYGLSLLVASVGAAVFGALYVWSRGLGFIAGWGIAASGMLFLVFADSAGRLLRASAWIAVSLLCVVASKRGIRPD